MPIKDPIKRKEWQRLYNTRNKERITAYKKAYFAIEANRIRHKQWCKERWEKTRAIRSTAEFKARENANQRRCRINDKRLCLEYYSNNTLKCCCCNEKIYDFLTIDHIYGGGNKQKKQLGIRSSNGFFRWLIKNRFPDGYTVMCYNCNCAKGKLGYCPHSRLITPEMKSE